MATAIVLSVLFTMIVLLLAGIVCLIAYLLAGPGIFDCFVKQGEIKTKMLGESFDGFLVNVRGFHKNTDSDGNLVPITAGADDGKSWINKKFGLYWVGIYPFKKILTYTFGWNKWAKDAQSTEHHVEPRLEKVNSVFWRYPYFIETSLVEIAGNLQVKFQILVTVQAVNPYKMLFGTLPSGTWLTQVTAALTESVILFASDKDINTLRKLKEKDAPSADEFVTALMAVNKTSAGTNPHLGVEETFGVKVIAVSFLGIEQEGGDAIRKATQAEELAELQGLATVAAAKAQREADILLGQGEGERAKTRGEGEAVGLKAKRDAVGSEAAFIASREADALEKTGVSVYAPGNKNGTKLMISTPAIPTTPPTSTT